MDKRQRVYDALWAAATDVVLAVRVLSTLATAVFVIVWIVAGVRNTLWNGWLWPAVVSALAVLASTSLYSLVKGRH